MINTVSSIQMCKKSDKHCVMLKMPGVHSPGVANFFFVTVMRKISSFFKNNFKSAVLALFRVKMYI